MCYFGYVKLLHSCGNSRESHILSRCLKPDLQYQPMDRHFSLKRSRCSASSLLCHILQNSNPSSTLYFGYFCLNSPPIPAYLGSGLQKFRKGQCCLSLQCYMRSLCPSGIHCCSLKPDSLKVLPTAFIFQLVFYFNSAMMPV